MKIVRNNVVVVIRTTHSYRAYEWDCFPGHLTNNLMSTDLSGYEHSDTLILYNADYTENKEIYLKPLII